MVTSSLASAAEAISTSGNKDNGNYCNKINNNNNNNNSHRFNNNSTENSQQPQNHQHRKQSNLHPSRGISGGRGVTSIGRGGGRGQNGKFNNEYSKPNGNVNAIEKISWTNQNNTTRNSGNTFRSNQTKHHNRSNTNNNNNKNNKKRNSIGNTNNMFYLHSSNDHAFIITRRFVGHNALLGVNRDSVTNNNNNQHQHQQPQQRYNFNGTDQPVSWESVRIVKYLSSLSSSTPSLIESSTRQTSSSLQLLVDDCNINKFIEAESIAAAAEANTVICPICLDKLLCGRLTKCGHAFCLPCIIHHVHTSYETSNNTAADSPKCPCCSLPIHLSDIKPLQVVPITTIPVPTISATTKTTTTTPGTPATTMQTMKFVKLHRTKSCAAPYLPLRDTPRRLSPAALPCQNDIDAMYCRFNYIDSTLYEEHLQSNLHDLEIELKLMHRQQEQQRQRQKKKQQQQMEMAKLKMQNGNSNNNYNNNYNKTIAGTAGRSIVTSSSTNSSFGCNKIESMNESMNIEMTCLVMAIDMVRREIFTYQNNDKEEEILLQKRFYEPSSGMYLNHPTTIFYNDESTANDTRYNGGTNTVAPSSLEEHVADYDDDNCIINMDASDSSQQQRNRGNSCCTYESVDDSVNSNRSNNNMRGYRHNSYNNSKRYHGTMYIEDEETETVFYQAEDGSLVFLSAFNINCLRTEFSATRPASPSEQYPIGDNDYDGTASTVRTASSNDIIDCPRTVHVHRHRSCIPPLPDTIEGRVVEIERVQLSPQLRQRYRFLSHLPTYTDIAFVELNIGYMLSQTTKNMFKNEFYKRKQIRLNKINAETKHDQRIQRQEQERINALKARYQSIDPNDEFFHPIPVVSGNDPGILFGEEFGPSLSPAYTTTSINDDAGSNTENTDGSLLPDSRIVATKHSQKQQLGQAPVPGLSFSSVCKIKAPQKKDRTVTTPALDRPSLIITNDDEFPPLGSFKSSSDTNDTATSKSVTTNYNNKKSHKKKNRVNAIMNTAN